MICKWLEIAHNVFIYLPKALIVFLTPLHILVSTRLACSGGGTKDKKNALLNAFVFLEKVIKMNL